MAAIIPITNLSAERAEYIAQLKENIPIQDIPVIDWTDPNILVTTYSDLGLMVLIIGFVYLILGYIVGSMRHVES